MQDKLKGCVRGKKSKIDTFIKLFSENKCVHLQEVTKRMLN